MFKNLLSENGLSLDRLKNFCAIAAGGGISRAAEGDPAKQSLYSRQVRELEQFFCTELTRRKGKGIELTEAGKELARQARSQFQGLEDFKRGCLAQPVEYRIGAGNSTIEWMLIPHLPTITAAQTSARITLMDMRTSHVVRALIDHTVDFGIVRKSSISSGLRFHSIGIVGYALFAPKAWTKKKRKQESLIKDASFAVTMGGEFLTKFETACEKHGLKPKIRFRCTSFTQAARLVETGQAMAVLPEMAVIKNAARLDFPWLKTYRREIGVAWHPRLFLIRPKAEGVLDTLKTLQGPD